MVGTGAAATRGARAMVGTLVGAPANANKDKENAASPAATKNTEEVQALLPGIWQKQGKHY